MSKKSSITPFTYINILKKSNTTSRGAKMSPLEASEFNKVYSPFLTNRAFGEHGDCVLIANELNAHPDMNPRAHFIILSHIIPARAFYSKYVAREKPSEIVKALMELFDLSQSKAIEADKCLGQFDRINILNAASKGGRE